MYALLISFLGVISYNLNYLAVLFLSLWTDIYIFKSKNDAHHSTKLLEFIEKKINMLNLMSFIREKRNQMDCVVHPTLHLILFTILRKRNIK